MNKAELRKKLSTMFEAGHVEGYLSHFPDNHIFGENAIGAFIDYLNSLPVPGNLPAEEDWTYLL